MTETVQKIAPQILDAIHTAQSVLLHLHPSPDQDSAGSALAMAQVVQSMGKQATVIGGDSELPSYLTPIPGAATIVPKRIDEVDLSSFDLFLILDSASVDQIGKACPLFPPSLRTVVIDHHATNPHFAEINLVEPSYAATSEILFDLFKEWNVLIDHDIALCLYVALYGDTGGFQYGNISKHLFSILGELVEIAPDFGQLIFKINNSNEKELIFFKGLALSSIQTFYNGVVAITAISYDDLQKKGIQKRNASGGLVSGIMKSVVGWNIAAVMVESEPGVVRLSMRTRNEKIYDVSKIVLRLGGGGHPTAAGATIRKPLVEAQEELLQSITEEYPELGRP